MTCYRPLKGVRGDKPGKSGKFPLIVKPASYTGAAIDVPCGRCIGCRIDHSRMWALRCHHEASLYVQNSFLTLTYSPEFLPAFGSLVKSDLQKFFKRLRKFGGSGIRYFACGEYGEQLSRPHYHVCLFNFDFADRKVWSVRGGVRLSVSDSLARLWPFGFSTVGDLTYESAAYVARYCMKKVTGDLKESHYTRLVPETGELVEISPEFVLMSRRPGVARAWYDRFSSDCFPSDYLTVNGRRHKVPRYYSSLYEQHDVFAHWDVKQRRRESAKAHVLDNTPSRLAVREQVTRAQLSVLKRSFENES